MPVVVAPLKLVIDDAGDGNVDPEPTEDDAEDDFVEVDEGVVGTNPPAPPAEVPLVLLTLRLCFFVFLPFLEPQTSSTCELELSEEEEEAAIA